MPLADTLEDIVHALPSNISQLDLELILPEGEPRMRAAETLRRFGLHAGLTNRGFMFAVPAEHGLHHLRFAARQLDRSGIGRAAWKLAGVRTRDERSLRRWRPEEDAASAQGRGEPTRLEDGSWTTEAVA